MKGRENSRVIACNFCVDEASQTVVAAELHESAANGKALLVVLGNIEESCGKTRDVVLADTG